MAEDQFEVLPVAQFQHQVGYLPAGFYLEDLDDILVIEVLGDLELMLQIRDSVAIGPHLSQQGLQRVFLVRVVIDCFPDLGSRAGTDQPDQAIRTKIIAATSHG